MFMSIFWPITIDSVGFSESQSHRAGIQGKITQVLDPSPSLQCVTMMATMEQWLNIDVAAGSESSLNCLLMSLTGDLSSHNEIFINSPPS